MEDVQIFDLLGVVALAHVDLCGQVVVFPLCILDHHVEVTCAQDASRAVVARADGQDVDVPVGVGGETSAQSVRAV